MLRFGIFLDYFCLLGLLHCFVANYFGSNLACVKKCLFFFRLWIQMGIIIDNTNNANAVHYVDEDSLLGALNKHMEGNDNNHNAQT